MFLFLMHELMPSIFHACVTLKLHEKKIKTETKPRESSRNGNKTRQKQINRFHLAVSWVTEHIPLQLIGLVN